MKLILTIFLLVAVSTVHSQMVAIGALEFIVQLSVWFFRSLFLLACEISDPKDKGVGNALWDSLQNKNNLNSSSCILGCTASVFYNSGWLRKLACKAFGDDICNVVNGCLSNIAHEKCSFVVSVGACIAPQLIPILLNNSMNLMREFLKHADHDVTTALGDILSKVYSMLIPFGTQPHLGQIKNSSVPLLPEIMHIFGFSNGKPLNVQKLATNNTQTIIAINATISTPTTSKTVPAATTTVPTITTKKSNTNLIGDLLHMFRL